MERTEIDDIVIEELWIAEQIFPDEPWITKFNRTKVTTAKSCRAERNGTIIIPMFYLQWDNASALRKELRPLIIDLMSGFEKRDKFKWQRLAKKMNLVKTITAEDMCECVYCGELTAFTRSETCHPCMQLEKLITKWPDKAKLVIENYLGE